MRRKLGVDAPSRRSHTPTRKPHHALALHGVRTCLDRWNGASETAKSILAPTPPPSSVRHVVSGAELSHRHSSPGQSGCRARDSRTILRDAATPLRVHLLTACAAGPPAIILGLTSVAWYATLVHYRPWGWVVTGSLTLLCCLSLSQLVRWRRHRETMLKVVANPKVWLIDCLLLVLGGGFAALGFLVTSSELKTSQGLEIGASSSRAVRRHRMTRSGQNSRSNRPLSDHDLTWRIPQRVAV